jgi:mannose-6-phosphate isomerase
MKTVDKPWGQELWIAYDNGRYGGKFIGIDAGKRLSKQYHEKKHETLFLLTGEAEIEMTGETRIYHQKDIIVIPPNVIHRIKAITDCIFIEFSSPELDDRIMLEDDYDRVH